MSTPARSLPLLLALLVACDPGAVEADAGRPRAEIVAEAEAADDATLEEIVAGYEEELDEMKVRLDELAAKAEAAGKQVLEDLMGAAQDVGSQEAVQQTVAELRAATSEVAAQMKDLKERLEIYVNELASRR